MNQIKYACRRADAFETRWHTHDTWELIYCIRGCGHIYLESGEEIKYEVGDAAVINAYQSHLHMACGEYSDIRILMEAPSFPDDTSFRISDDLEKHLLAAFQQAAFSYSNARTPGKLVFAPLGDRIAGMRNEPYRNTEYSKSVGWIREEIRRGYTDLDFSLKACIGQLPYHYDYMRKRFQKETGSTPLEYLTELRMKKAAMILTDQSRDDLMSETARLCGYRDALYFSRVFRKFYGMPPSAYAKSGRIAP